MNLAYRKKGIGPLTITPTCPGEVMFRRIEAGLVAAKPHFGLPKPGAPIRQYFYDSHSKNASK
jgi:hypothetical protein